MFVPKWKKDATKFDVGVNYNEKRGYQSSIPKPVIDILGDPERIRFVVKGKKIELVSGDDEK